MKFIIDLGFQNEGKKDVARMFKIMADVPNFDKTTKVFFMDKAEKMSADYFPFPDAEECYFDIEEEQMCYIYRINAERYTHDESSVLLRIIERLKKAGFNWVEKEILSLQGYLSKKSNPN